MTDSPDLRSLSRRAMLGAVGVGLSVSFLGGRALAAGELPKRRMVMILCRGGADGLSITPPVGDPGYAALRREVALSPDQVLKLDGAFGLHPALTTTHDLMLKGQARFAPAIASPDRSHSHFEAQDVLELGVAQARQASSGWLNRALEAMAPSQKVSGLSVGGSAPLILRGKVQTASWSPGKGIDQTAYLPTLLQDLYKSDPLIGPAFARGLETETMAQLALKASATPDVAMMAAPTMAGQGMMTPTPPSGTVTANQLQGRPAARKLAQMLAKLMLEPGGPRVAVLSLDGWDTHSNQMGQIATRLSSLDAVIEGLHAGLGPMKPATSRPAWAWRSDSPGPGRSHRRCSAASWSGFSTPSATTFMPMLEPRLITARTMASSSAFWTKDLSIFSRSTGNWRRLASWRSRCRSRRARSAPRRRATRTPSLATTSAPQPI
jgi:uncharacterized protein (DUF1501 family)